MQQKKPVIIFAVFVHRCHREKDVICPVRDIIKKYCEKSDVFIGDR